MYGPSIWQFIKLPDNLKNSNIAHNEILQHSMKFKIFSDETIIL